MKVKPKLYLNMSPQTQDDGSLAFARNMKIDDDGILLEALSWYILYKYLSRGSKHTVYSLQSNSPVTNPFIQWNTLRPKAMASVKGKLGNAKGWNNFFYNSTFLPRG